MLVHVEFHNEFVDCKTAEVRILIIEGLCAKRAYIGFWPIFIFCRIELIFHLVLLFV